MITREEWGARLPTGSTELPLSQIKGVAVHYSASAADQVGTSDRVRTIQNFHMDTRGWFDIAYNFLFTTKGKLYEGRGYGQRSAAQGSNYGNDYYYAICWLGLDDKNHDDVTATGRKVLGQFILDLEKKVGHKLDVKPHSFFFATECPGDELRSYIALRGWELEVVKKNWPTPLPKWFWTWNAWRLGEGPFKQYGPKNRAHRPKNVPKFIPPWAWARARLFDRQRSRG